MKKIILATVVLLSLLLASCGTNLRAHKDSEYYPLIEKIDEYRAEREKLDLRDNFRYFFLNIFGGVKYGEAPEFGTDSAMGGAMENGGYIEVTDNQVAGVVESDVFKITDKYIFRLGGNVLRVYSVDKENSSEVGGFEIPQFEDDRYGSYYYGLEMYLSEDCNTITLVGEYITTDLSSSAKVGIISLDVSDVTKIKERSRVSVDGSINTTRMVDGKLIIVSDFCFNRKDMNYSNPGTFVPSINYGNGDQCIEFDDIVYPESINSTFYSVVTLIDSENLEILGAKALLNFTSDVYISQNNIYITREYTKNNENIQTSMTDIAVMNYSTENLSEAQIVSIPGWAEDQYSFDERDGYLRVVTSTSETITSDNGWTSSALLKRNAGLYIIDLKTNEVAYKVENFAPDGEQATAVRFDGDKCYVCTAVVVSFTDPVFFFDLSDYENISYTDTGIIEGYSDHLINYGDGKLLGIGRENWEYSKVEIYEETQNGVESIFELKFYGNYSLDYKAYMVNREEGLFGFGVDYFYIDEQDSYNRKYSNCYILVSIAGDDIEYQIIKNDHLHADQTRAVYIDGYLYITTEHELFVEKIK